MKLLSTLAGLAAPVLLGCGSALAAFSPPAQLVVVSDDGYPPFLFRTDTGKLQGIILDKWQLWSGKTGIPVTVEGMEWIKAQESVRNGTADVVDAMVSTEARAKVYEFSAPYADVEARVFFNRSITGISDVASMRGFTIGAKDGSACAAWLEERGVKTLLRFPSSDAVVEAARTREVPLFCMDLTAAQYFIFKLNLADEFRQTEPLYVARFHWAVAKGRVELRDFIQQGFERVSAAELRVVLSFEMNCASEAFRFTTGDETRMSTLMTGLGVAGRAQSRLRGWCQSRPMFQFWYKFGLNPWAWSHCVRWYTGSSFWNFHW